MLNIKNFYAHYGHEPSSDEYIEIDQKLVMVQNEQLYITCLQNDMDPFQWLSQPYDGVVFRTQSGYLATVAFFDGQEDRTQEAVQLCNALVGVA